MERNDLESLAIALANAKHAEDEAKSARIEAENELAAAIGGKDNGSTSVKCGRISVTVKRGWNYSVSDMDALASAYPQMVRTKTVTELDDKAYEAVRVECPEAFADISQYVSVKPKKVAVSLKL